jgi:hypothetical protein
MLSGEATNTNFIALVLPDQISNPLSTTLDMALLGERPWSYGSWNYINLN